MASFLLCLVVCALTCADTSRGVADKSLARPGRKQATAIEIIIYSSYPHEAQYTP